MRHCHEVSTRTPQRRFSLDRGEKFHQTLSLHGVFPSLVEQSRAPCRTFDPKDLDFAETGVANFGSQVLRTVKIRRREVLGMVCRITMLTGGNIHTNDLAKLRVLKEARDYAFDKPIKSLFSRLT